MTEKPPDKPDEPLEVRPKGFDVFISYSHEDKRLAQSIRNGLVHRGLACWLDEEQLKPGDDWSKVLREAISDSRLCLMVLGRHAEDKPWVSREWAFVQASAWDRSDLTVIPVLLDNVELPAFLRKWQSLRCDRRPAAIEHVCSQVARTIEQETEPHDSLNSTEPDASRTAQRFRQIVKTLKLARVASQDQSSDSHE
jgi:hypothetical protein